MNIMDFMNVLVFGLVFVASALQPTGRLLIYSTIGISNCHIARPSHVNLTGFFHVQCIHQSIYF